MGLEMKTIQRTCGKQQWLRATTEKYRIDKHVLDSLSAAASVTPQISGPLATLRDRCDEWIKNTLFNSKSSAPLRITHHLLQRAREYEGKMSRCNRYVELYSNERQIIETLGDILNLQSIYEIVEIGLNEQRNVCKLALLLPFSQWIKGNYRDDRKLFLLVGCDGGLKTFYSVQGVKFRQHYQMDSSITPLSLSQLQTFCTNS